MEKMDVTYRCDKCEREFTREEARNSDKVSIGTDKVDINNFVKDDLGAKVEIGLHEGCGGKVYVLASKNLK